MSAHLFRYTGVTPDGELVAGSVRAESDRLAAVDLRRRALFVTSIRPTKPARSGRLGGRKPRAMLAFFRAFSVLVRAGVPIRRALLVAIQHCEDRVLREALRAALADVEQGYSLSAALSRRPNEFSRLQTAMIGAGEAGGVLDDVLERIAGALEHDHAVRKKIQAALIYPCVVALVAGVLVVFLLGHVVPMFASIFVRFGVPLPLPTRLLLEGGSMLSAPRNVLVLASTLLSAGTTTWLLLRRRLEPFEKLRLGLPVVGKALRYAIVARVARMLSILLRSGVGVLTAIEVVGPVAGARSYERGLEAVSDALRRGEAIHRALARSTLFDPLTLALVGAGEESGALDAMLLTAANYLDVEVEATLLALAALLEPALIGFLGLVVGLIVFSIFLPLYSLIGSIS